MALLIAGLLVNNALLFLVSRHSELRVGNAPDFWERACGIEITGFAGHPLPYSEGGIHYPTEGQLFYYSRAHHGVRLYYVSRDQLEASRTLALASLSKTITKTATPSLWQEDSNPLLQRKNKARQRCLAYLEAEGETFSLSKFGEHLAGTASQETWHFWGSQASIVTLWERHKGRWVGFAFEFLFINAWLIFTLWPFLKNRSTRQKTFYLAASPLLFCIPYYLGYPAGLPFWGASSGGFIYPFFVMNLNHFVFWVPLSEFELALHEIIPKILEPLSQIPHDGSVTKYKRAPNMMGMILLGGFLALAYLTIRKQRGAFTTE